MGDEPRLDADRALADLALDAYLDRIGLERRPRPDLQGLEEVQLAHLGSIPFENLDVVLRRPIRLDLGSLQAKLVDGRRGGYCFEQNTLFVAALRALGFEVRTLEARVRPPGSDTVTARTHMTLRVELNGRLWLADVGFGGDGPLRPVPFDGTASDQPNGRFRIVDEPGARVLRVERAGAETDLFAFAETPAHPIDFEVANHYTSTHPGSVFVRTVTLQRSTPDAVHIVRGRTHTVREGGEERVRELSDDAFRSLLREPFGLSLAEEEVAAILTTLPPDRPAPAGGA